MSQQAVEAQLNWFRQGLFAPVTEEATAFDLPVTGRIPSELNGRYLATVRISCAASTITSTIGSSGPAWYTA